MDGRASLVIASVVLGGCSLLRDPGDFTIVDDAGTDAMPMCVTADDCPARARASASCTDAMCEYTCETGFDDCDGDATNGCETDTTRDVDNCGACGTACMFDNATGACSDSMCELMNCRTGFEDCDGDPGNGCEASLQSTVTCGSCDNSCAAGELCDSTGATPICNEDCGGTICGDECVDTSTNPQRCGDCDNECPVPAGAEEATCAGSMCGFSCLAGRDDCDPDADGCETNTTNDLANCGGCGMMCDDTRVLTQSCAMSACEIDSCEPDYGDCNDDADDGCEASLTDDPNHCGACGNVCDSGTNCRLGVCDPVVQVARGEGQACVVRESGAVLCWGESDSSQAGVGSPRAAEAPQPIVVSSAPGADVFRARFVSAGNSFTCAIDLDGELWCWGQGSRLGAGPGTGNTPFPQPVVADTEAGMFDPRTFVDLDANEGHGCAIDDMGTVWCWGIQQNGSIPGSGDGEGARRVTGLPTDAVNVAVNNGASCAALDDGSVWCWGTNNQGQLGNDTTTNSATPVQVTGITGATVVDGMWQTFCAIHDGGRLSCWGNNSGGHIGPRRTGNRELTPIEVAPGPVLNTWQSLFSLCWETADGATCSGRNVESQWGNGETTPFTTDGGDIDIPELDGMEGFDAGRRGGCAIRDGEAYCWGASFEGSIPRDTIQIESPSPVRALDGAEESGYSALAVGADHACAIQTGIDRCWGINVSGALGDMTSLSKAHPVDVVTLTNVVHIATGRGHSCAINDGGSGRQAYCWGGNASGQLGSAGSSASTPRLVDLADELVVIEAGSSATCAITTTNAVVCWGFNSEGQAGQPLSSPTVTPGPLATPINDATALALGHRHSCALRSGGTVECWGANESGQLGDGTDTPRHTPAPVTGLTGVTAIAAGSAHTCAILDTGQVRCWGSSFRGQLGGPSGGLGVPVLVNYTAQPAVAIAAGAVHSCAAYTDGSVRCWGANDYYQLGRADTSDATSPVVVAGLTDVTALSSANDTGFLTCALQGDADPAGSIQCWGRNEYGAAGHGTSLYYLPTRVELP